MAEQLTLLPEPGLEYTLPNPEEWKQVEDIALEACGKELLYGEPKSHQPEERLDVIVKHFPGSRTHDYFIKFEDKFIGYIKIWDGWLPLEGEYVSPEVEVAFIHPKYEKYTSMLKKKIRSLLLIIEEDPE